MVLGLMEMRLEIEVISVAPPGGGDPAILMEDGSYILLEDGSHTLLE